MRKRIFGILFFAVVSFIVFGSPAKSEAASYPNSSVTVQAGDIIYSSKSPSTYFVGHIGIVGSDGKVYHSYPNSTGKRVDTVSNYINNLFGNSDVIVRRYANTSTNFTNVGNVAQSLYNNVESYSLDKYFNNYKNNYCSKFIWQAFYLATGIDPLNEGYGYYDTGVILPSEFKSSTQFNTIKSYNR